MSLDNKTLNQKLIDSCEKGNLEAVRNAIKEGADINHYDKYGLTPLYYSVFFKHYEIVEFLLKSGANIYAPSGISGYNTLHLAAQEGSKRMLILLLVESIFHGKDGINNRVNNNGETALEIALECKKFEHARLLALYGADKSGVNRNSSIFNIIPDKIIENIKELAVRKQRFEENTKVLPKDYERVTSRANIVVEKAIQEALSKGAATCSPKTLVELSVDALSVTKKRKSEDLSCEPSIKRSKQAGF
ncbi:MAG: ankyrin repeat domain-containing protein [Wolbachia endosymbiont of Tyrophagus putrescentiae]|nr:ankyrin repeat domain-containing protein [Wolbachia endosymbiont of Tyrophagus putrescentiae]